VVIFAERSERICRITGGALREAIRPGRARRGARAYCARRSAPIRSCAATPATTSAVGHVDLVRATRCRLRLLARRRLREKWPLHDVTPSGWPGRQSSIRGFATAKAAGRIAARRIVVGAGIGGFIRALGDAPKREKSLRREVGKAQPAGARRRVEAELLEPQSNASGIGQQGTAATPPAGMAVEVAAATSPAAGQRQMSLPAHRHRRRCCERGRQPRVVNRCAPCR